MPLQGTNKSGLIHSGSVMGTAINIYPASLFIMHLLKQLVPHMHGSTHEVTTYHLVIIAHNSSHVNDITVQDRCYVFIVYKT